DRWVVPGTPGDDTCPLRFLVRGARNLSGRAVGRVRDAKPPPGTRSWRPWAAIWSATVDGAASGGAERGKQAAGPGAAWEQLFGGPARCARRSDWTRATKRGVPSMIVI